MWKCEQHGRGLYSFFDLSIYAFSVGFVDEEVRYLEPQSSGCQMGGSCLILGPTLAFLHQGLP